MTKYIPYGAYTDPHTWGVDKDFIAPYSTYCISGWVFRSGDRIQLQNIHCRELWIVRTRHIREISFKSLKFKYIYLDIASLNLGILKDILSKWTCKKIFLMYPSTGYNAKPEVYKYFYSLKIPLEEICDEVYTL